MDHKNHFIDYRILYYCFAVFFMVGCICHAQHPKLQEIIDSDETNETKQLQIDAFYKANLKKITPELLADSYHETGKWHFYNWMDTYAEKDIDEAIAYTQSSLEIKKDLTTLDDGSLEKTAYNLATFQFYKGDFFSALHSYQYLVRNGQDREYIQDAKLEIGRLYGKIGDFYKAADWFGDIINTYNASDAKAKSMNLLDAYFLRAETYFFIDKLAFYDKIKSDLAKADSLLQGGDPTEMHFNKRRQDQFQGNLLLENGNYDAAIAYFGQVLADSVNLYPDELARVHNSIAYTNIKLKNYDQASKQLQKAIAKDTNYTEPYENFGDLYLAQNEFEKGLTNYQKAIVFAIDKDRKIDIYDLPPLEDLEVAPEKLLLLNHLVTKANGWLRYYEYNHDKKHANQALETFALADQLVDIIRSESTEYQSKLFWREKGASLYTKAVEVCYLLDKPEEAYYFMERNKALLLLEDISNEQAKEIAKLPEAMVAREFKLKRAILLSENDFKNFESASTKAFDSIKKHVYENKRNYNTFVDSLAKAFPEYANIKKKATILPYLNFKSNYIAEDEVVLQYILNDEQGYGLLSTVDRTHFFKLKNAPLLNEQLLTLYAQLTDMTSSREKLAHYNKTANDVFHRLIPEKVRSAIKGKKLTIVADYILQQIPFEALVVDLKQRTYLIEEVEIRYAYSISYLDAKKEIAQNPEKELLGLAPIQFATLGLPKLAFSGEEINEVHKIYSGEVALNGEATKSRLLDSMNNFRILHLSTHADVDESSNPWIAFSDAKLFLNEIYAAKNQADMVVLSGCNTSLGELKKGEGAMSLARGFFHSGAKSVVSSLWTITDKSSKNLMTDFYKGLDKGMTKAAALREAKITYIDKFRGTTVSPSFWAGLIVIGDNSPIPTSVWTKGNLLWIALGTVLVLGGLFFYRRRFS